MEENSIGLYIHIPFCAARCNYCNFNSSLFDPYLADRYIKALKKEIEIKSRDHAGKNIFSIYIGGGTPTILTEKALEELLTVVKTFFLWENNIEVTIEANPGTLSAEKIKILKESGVTRLSMGVQTFNPVLLKVLGRVHSKEDVYNSFKLARKAGFDNINIDLLFSIPGQIYGSWRETLCEAVKLRPEHISMYGLIYEYGTSITRKIKQGELEIVSPDAEFIMYRYGINFLKKRGYRQYEISNFSIPDRECKHNLVYWHNKKYLGLGAGAVSYIGERRISNIKNIINYIEKINKKENAGLSKEYISREKQIKEAIMLNLRLIKGLSKHEFYTRFGIKVDDIWGDTIKRLVSKKLIIDTPDFLRLTRRGIYLNNDVLIEFI
ncbi:oxygen-independent coproporphyrinogen III oxidase [Candidatus Desantisbacteria bacterium]|nr:oxygen-independent coproporphyrinogen III oxidase [Candidatus Desantisbacteria bacterium]